MAEPVCVRIAPSPTGEPHVGTAYIALFNYCFARANGGRFILRIEDTDQTRSKRAYEEAIFKALRWLGLDWDEGPDKGGPHAPYRQSERTALYREHADILLAKGAAYRCFCTADRLEEMRKKLIAEKKNFFYDGRCRALAPAEALARAKAGEPHVVRLAIPREPGLRTGYYDEIRKKEIDCDNAEIDDQILLKADGFPTYHLANVVDDHLMGVTHIMRAEEWIPSTPKHILLYRAFGWTPPKFAHVSLLRNADKSKVSKRKNPVSLDWFRAAGYTREALINFLGLMGYSSGIENERFGIAEMMKGFSIDRITTSSPVFDLAKLNALNEEYIRKYTADEYAAYLAATIEYAARYLAPILHEVQSRHKAGQGFAFWTDLFFRPSLEYRKEDFVIKDLDKPKIEDIIKQCTKALEDCKSQDKEALEAAVGPVKDASGVKPGAFMMVLRLAVTGSATSLPLFETMAMLGRDRTVLRLKEALAFVKRN